MTPHEQLVQAVCESFRRTGDWPRYRDLQGPFLAHVSLEHVLAENSPVRLQVVGSGSDERIEFASLEDYGSVCNASEDLDRVAEAANLFAERAGSGADHPSLTAMEIGTHLGISGVDLARVCRLLDREGQGLETGGTRGDNVDQWSFGVSERAVYFKGVSSFAEFRAARKRLDEVETLRAQRAWQGWGTERPQDTPLSPKIRLPQLDSIDYELHPAVANAADTLLRSGHPNEAVRKAMERLESFLQDQLGEFHVTGQKLIGRALGGQEPLVRLNALGTQAELDEQEGFKHLAIGAMAAFRNYFSHRSAPDISMTEAIERLVTISLLFRRMEQVLGSSKLPEASATPVKDT